MIKQDCYKIDSTRLQQYCYIMIVTALISFLYVCMVNTIYLLSFVETPRKLGSSSVLIIILMLLVSTDEDPSLRIESSAIINLRGVSTKLNKYVTALLQQFYL